MFCRNIRLGFHAISPIPILPKFLTVKINQKK